MTDEIGIQPHELGVFQGEGKTKAVPESPEFGVGTAATHPYGVLYQGAWETEFDGTCRAVRLNARALAKAGVPVLLKSYDGIVLNRQGFPEPAFQAGIDEQVRREVGELTSASIGCLSVRVKHLVVRDAQQLRRAIMPMSVNEQTIEDPDEVLRLRQAIYASTIIYSVWERDTIDPSLVQHLDRVAMNWVPCEQNAEALRRSGVSRVEVIPHPYAEDEPLLKLRRRRYLHQRRFYSIGRWEPRKGQDRLVGAFLRAFRPKDDAALTIKYSGAWDDYPTPQASLAAWLEDPEVKANGWSIGLLRNKLAFISGRLPQDEITKLHFYNNIYVSASHGEAWNLPAFDAKLAGNRLVHVPYGGTEDFCDPTDVGVPYQMGPVHPSYRWEDTARWAEFSVDDLKNALLAASPPKSYQEPSAVDRCRIDLVGAKMRSSILRILKGFDGRAYRSLATEEQ